MKTLIKIFIPILILGFLFTAPSFVFGEDENVDIKELNKKIQQRKDELSNIQKKQQQYTNALRRAQSEKANLKNQLSILDNRLSKAELNIEEVQTEIDVTGLEINKIDKELEDIKNNITREKNHLGEILRLMQKHDRVGALEIVLLNNNLSEFINQLKYLENINKEVGNGLQDLKNYQYDSEQKLGSLDEKNKDLKNLKKDLQVKVALLADEKDSKSFLLDKTKSSEEEYQRLLNLAKQEQADASADIAAKERQVREKLSKISEQKLEFNDTGLIWPVPKNTITSTFHDPDYPYRYIFEHPAVDIKAGQGTTIKAAASGYVARAKDAGKGYSYIMIIHGDGLATVYGHVSSIYVEEDEYVVQGQAIGLSGGMPGTPGAGRLTTGAHLHFEVRLNGIPVDPLSYLP